MKKNILHTWFTLIEVIVAVTVFSLIMISVMTIFYLASQMNTRIELQRHMQENIKNTLDIIAQDIRTWSIKWVRQFEASCVITEGENSHILCLSQWVNTIEVWLGKKISENSWNIIHNPSDCLDISSQCYILKRENNKEWYPLTNSMSHISHLDFTFGNTKHPKVMIALGIRPALLKGLASNLLEAQEIKLQTTLSERFIPQY